MKKALVLALSATLCLSGAGAVLAEEAPEAVEAAAETSAEEGAVVETEAFSVTVPADILAISDVVPDDNGISFYEKISHESFGGGFAGKIAVYESVADYGDMPSYKRGGEIAYPDGSKLDIVLEYSSDVQYDMENEDSVNNYRKILDEFAVIASEIVPSGDGTFVPQDQVDTTSVYADILQKLTDDLMERKDREGLEEDGFSYVYAYSYELEDKDPLDEIGFAYTDINNDGYAELVIGSVDDSVIYDMYAQVDGEPVHVFSGGERNTYTLTGHGGEDSFYEICNEASGSAFLHETTYYILPSNTSEMLEQATFIYDAEKDEENPWFTRYAFEEEPEQLSEEEWNQRKSNFGETGEIEYTPLSQR